MRNDASGDVRPGDGPQTPRWPFDDGDQYARSDGADGHHAVAPQLNSHDVQRLTAYDPAALAVVWSAARSERVITPERPWAHSPTSVASLKLVKPSNRGIHGFSVTRVHSSVLPCMEGDTRPGAHPASPECVLAAAHPAALTGRRTNCRRPTRADTSA